MAVLIIHYDTTTGRTYAASINDGDIAGGGVWSGALAVSGIIFSGHIASGQIGGTHIANGAITSSNIASGFLAGFVLGSGVVRSGMIGNAAVVSGSIASGAIGGVHHANQSLVSANFAANAIGGVHIANQGLLSANYASGSVGNTHIAANAVLSAQIASGIVGGGLLQNFGVVSGKLGSGSVNTTDLASGISVSISQVGQETTYKAGAPVSAYFCVQFTTSGYFAINNAMNYSSMPTIGIAAGNIASGATGAFQYAGRMTAASGVWNFSGYNGLRVFTGVSGEVTVSSPSVSGSCVQSIGKVISLDTVMVKPDLFFMQIGQ